MRFSLTATTAMIGSLSLLMTISKTHATSFQSGPHIGAVYAAAMVIDPETPGTFYYTGITYDPTLGTASTSTTANQVPHCFVAKSQQTSTTATSFFSLMAQFASSTPALEDSCRSLVVISPEQLAVIGTADEGSPMFESNVMNSIITPQAAFAMTVETNTLSKIAGLTLTTKTRVPYPQAVVTDPTDSDKIFVASMTATVDAEQPSTQEYPNWTHLFQHGTSFELTAESLEYHEGATGETFDGILDLGGSSTGAVSPLLQSNWTQYFPVSNETVTDGSVAPPRPSVYVGGMIWKSNVGLIVAGSTSAHGVAYGPAEGDDEDGFVAVLDPSTGQLGNQAVTASGNPAETNERHGSEQYDIITSICDDPNDDSSFYIVGATKGDMLGILPIDENLQPPLDSLQAFVRKIKVTTLLSDWTVQLAAWIDADTLSEVVARGCVVDSDGYLFLVGEVTEGAGMVEGTSIHVSQGGQDIWVAKINTRNANRMWIQQTGSSGTESLARNGPIALDVDGNAVVFGNTDGPLYRSRQISNETDLFVMTFDKETGAFNTTTSGNGPDNTQEIPEEDLPAFVDDDIVDDDDQTNVIGNVDVDALPETAAFSSALQIHQSGPNGGAMYASSIVYDPVTDLAIILGISYTSALGSVITEPSCLIAKIQISSMQTKAYTILGSEYAMDTCRDIVMQSSENSGINSANIIAVGNSEVEGQDQSGSVMRLTGDDLSIGTRTLLSSDSIPYPQALVIDGDFIYVASMTSNDKEQNANDESGNEFPNWTYLNKYGHGFTMTIEKFSLSNIESVWSKNYPVVPDADGIVFNVLVGGMILKEDVGLIVVGSTRAKGPAYGEAFGEDEDGFITLIDPEDGALVAGRTNNMRIGSDRDDVISEICDVPGDAESVIIVGATTGDVGGVRDQEAGMLVLPGSLQWYVKRINLLNLEEEWSIQGGAVPGSENDAISSTTAVYAVGCHVDGDTIYVGGTVENGAMVLDVRSPLPSSGGNDVWVASLALNTGAPNWIRQFGSVGDDELARNGGITTDSSGNVVVFGDTTGALSRDRAVGANADIFLAVLSASDGAFGTKGESTGAEVQVSKISPTAAPVPPPVMDEDFDDNAQAIPDSIVAIQFGSDAGPTYAGGMDYDPFFNSLYLTGATYGNFISGDDTNHNSYEQSQCFFARIDLPNLEVVQRETYSVAGEMDACTAVASNAFNRQRNIILLGTTEPGGILTELAENQDELQYGFAMDLSLQTMFEFIGGTSLGGGVAPVVFPVALVSDEDTFWTVSMVSNDEKISPDYDKVKSKEFPNFTNGGVIKYGNAYLMNIESYKYSRAGDGDAFAQGSAKTFEKLWSQPFDVGSGGILATGMINMDGKLVIVGSIHSEGMVSGMIAKIDQTNGDMDTTGEKAVENYGVDEKSDTWIMNVCAGINNTAYFYIVGATQQSNKNKVLPWVAKIETSTLKTVWSKKFYLRFDDEKGKQAASFYGCAVHSSGEFLYVAGTVEDGSVLRFSTDEENEKAMSAGGDDVVVAQLATTSGIENWIKQIGSNGEDRLARSGGVKVDKDGNAVLYGETTGTFFRDRSNDNADQAGHSNIFVMLVDKEKGIHQPPLRGPKLSQGKTAPGEFFNKFTKSINAASKTKAGAIVGYIVLALVLVGGIFYLWRQCYRHRRPNPKTPSMYDASASADFDENSDSNGAFGLLRRKPLPPSRTQNLRIFMDDPAEDDGALGSPEEYDKKYFDVPQCGKTII